MNENTQGKVAVVTLALDNDTAKKIAMLIAGKVPKVGGVLSGMIGMFWPTDEVSLWDQIKDQVEALVSQKLSEYNLKVLAETLQGLRNEVRNYKVLTDEGQKRTAMQSAVGDMEMCLPRFLSGDPASNFSCFWGLALLHLSVRRELYDLMRDEANLKLLESTAITYCAYGRAALSRIYNQRLEQLKVAATSENYPGKVSDWVIDVSLDDTKTGTNMFHFARVYKKRDWDVNVLNERTSYCNTEITNKWNAFLPPLQTQLLNWAYEAITILEKDFPYTPEQGLKEIKETMEPKSFEIFERDYYPTGSIYHDPKTTHKIETIVTPVVKLNPF